MLTFVEGAELLIHNATFDVGFLNHELNKLGGGRRIQDYCGVVDTLAMARQLFPGQKNSLDALCKRYGVDNSQRQLHGALLDAEILADVYLHMTGGQTALTLGGSHAGAGQAVVSNDIRRLDSHRPRLRVIAADASELAAHRDKLAVVQGASGGKCLWIEG